MIFTAGPAVLAGVTLASMWLIARGLPAGWAVAVAWQFLWVPYDILTGQLAFIAITAVSVPVYVAGWHRCRRVRP